MDNGQIDFTNLSAKECLRILLEHPDQADKCDWKEMRKQLDGLDWVRLLETQPQFADQCRWASLNGYDWAELLAEQPQFADKFDWKMLRDYHDFCDDPDNFDEDEYRRWERLFSVHGQFVDKCAWTKLNGEDWAHLLSVHPQLFCKCDWTKLDGRDWAYLLYAQPQFSYKCDKWDEIPAKGPYRNSRSCWLGLLERQPWFADKCDKWGEFDERDWAELLRILPQFADKRGNKPPREPTKLLRFTISGVHGRPIELGRRLMKDGDDQYESGFGVNGVIPDSTLFANGEPGATMIQVRLDDEIVFERLLDFSKPEGLVFEDRGPLYDENEDPGDGWWLYGAERWAGVTWSPWTMEVPDDFQFDPGKLAIPFYHARIDDESEPRLVFRPREISYDGHKAAGEGLEWNDQTHSSGVAYWTVENGVARQYIMPDCY